LNNPLANRWYLGRQALFLADTGYNGIEARGGSTGFHNIRHDAAVEGYPTSGNGRAGGLRNTMDFPTASGSDLGLWGGVSDVADADMAGIVAQLNAAPTTNYHSRALRLAYVSKRLRANPYPLFDAGNLQRQYQAWSIAQMHPIFARGVSDFVVEFAGDYDNDDPTDGIQGPDGQIDLDDPTDGSIRWYAHDGFQNNPDPSALGYNNSLPKTYSFEPVRSAVGTIVDTSTGGVANEAYYIDDTSVAPYNATPAVAHVDGAFIFRHDDDDAYNPPTTDGSLWPHLIRIRYRLHDPDGVVMQGDGQHGKWFETIIAVNRP